MGMINSIRRLARVLKIEDTEVAAAQCALSSPPTSTAEA
jgi:hypothetical protein